MATKEDKTFVGPDEGAYLPVLDIVHKVTAEASGGSLTIEEWGLPPGMMIPPHTHAREDESDFVLEGELKCDVGGEVVLAPAGSYVLKPRNVAHAFYNAGSETVRVVEIITPGGLEGYFDEYEQIASKLSSGALLEPRVRLLPADAPRAEGVGGGSPRGRSEARVVSAGSEEANREMGLASPVLLDQGFAVGRAFGASGTPSAVLVDAEGKVASEVAVGAPGVLELAGGDQAKT